MSHFVKHIHEFGMVSKMNSVPLISSQFLSIIKISLQLFIFLCAGVATERETISKFQMGLRTISWKKWPSLLGISLFVEALSTWE